LEGDAHESLEDGVMQILGDSGPLGQSDLVIVFEFDLSPKMTPSLHQGYDKTNQATD
jgi:hypothetical protein